MGQTPYGKAGLMVTRLGTGTPELGGYSLSGNGVETAGGVLNAALDKGINFVDTASCYGNGEELNGRAVSGRK